MNFVLNFVVVIITFCISINNLSAISCSNYFSECMDNICISDKKYKRCNCSELINTAKDLERQQEKKLQSLMDKLEQVEFMGFSKDKLDSIFEDLNQFEAEDSSILDELTDIVAALDTGFYGVDIEDSIYNDYEEEEEITIGEQLFLDTYNKCYYSFKGCQKTNLDLLLNKYTLKIYKDCKSVVENLEKVNKGLTEKEITLNATIIAGSIANQSLMNNYSTPDGCQYALNKCFMTEDVCSDNFKKCLDPTSFVFDSDGKGMIYNKDTLEWFPKIYQIKNKSLWDEFYERQLNKCDSVLQSCQDFKSEVIISYKESFFSAVKYSQMTSMVLFRNSCEIRLTKCLKDAKTIFELEDKDEDEDEKYSTEELMKLFDKPTSGLTDDENLIIEVCKDVKNVCDMIE
ncbi:MAG: hypothetical protein JJV93_00645 [Alphaproteobacteria bacterium]|nr:hypothetical protein [Alphaproteobacteria bacterium]